jgi:hypothetical protein
VERGFEEVGCVVSEGDASSSFGAGVGGRKAGGVGVALEEHVGWACGAVVVRVFGCMSNEAVKGFHKVDGGS